VTRRPRLAIALAISAALAVGTAGCSSASSSSDSAPASSAAVAAPASSSSSSSPSSAPSAAEAPAALSGPCDLLTVEQIEAAIAVAMPDGVEKQDDVRKIQMCTWTSTDPFAIVAASLTDVGAAEAFQTNFDLAPAYFDGDPVKTDVPGTDKAYAVQQPDVGWVVGAIAKGRFLQIQVGGTDITQAQVTTLMQDAVNRLPS
jgi:hypothetical protein